MTIWQIRSSELRAAKTTWLKSCARNAKNRAIITMPHNVTSYYIIVTLTETFSFRSDNILGFSTCSCCSISTKPPPWTDQSYITICSFGGKKTLPSMLAISKQTAMRSYHDLLTKAIMCSTGKCCIVKIIRRPTVFSVSSIPLSPGSGLCAFPSSFNTTYNSSYPIGLNADITRRSPRSFYLLQAVVLDTCR